MKEGGVHMRLALAQINPTVGDLEGNRKKIEHFASLAKKEGTDIIAFPELSLTGYPPEDLLLVPRFVNENIKHLKEIRDSLEGIVAVVGFVDKEGDSLFNAAALIAQRETKGIYHKILLPNYGVFDEKRYFQSGSQPFLFKYGNLGIGICICEDVWHREGPVPLLAERGANLVIVINASPYHIGKREEREKVVRTQAIRNKVYIAYVNLVGGQDELVFDGRSFVVDLKGEIISTALPFEEDLLLWDMPQFPTKNFHCNQMLEISPVYDKVEKPTLVQRKNIPLEPLEEVYQALLLGLRDYVLKNGFQKAVVGLSGGIDSSLTAVLAVDALGKENVTGIYLPTRYSSPESYEDAKHLAENLDIELIVIPIDELYQSYLFALDPFFKGSPFDKTEENLQARIRGNILMAFSNKFGYLLLTTGNKSEMSTGYTTLYGDMAGGFAPLKDVSKTLVYKLAKYRNERGQVIPERVFIKAPSAELREGQKDTDTLPPYELLDPILKFYIEENKDVEEIISLGFPEGLVKKVIEMVDKSEYKRRQAPPGIKITPRAFGKDRRMPITKKYRR